VPQSGYLNLIHVEDAVRVILAAESRAKGPEEGNFHLYVVSDGHPVERGEYYAELARCFGAPPPKLLGVDSSLPTGRRRGGSKRLSNAKMLRELGVTLAYPTYREGLAAIVASQQD
jgi:nucleoside-diphosphate-sugar epimerase